MKKGEFVKMEFMTIEELKNHKWVGNHASDHLAFEAAIKLAKHYVEKDMRENAKEVIHLMHKHGMGIDEYINDETLDLYLK